jgi:ABC-type multidrug transport system fused ATPase/permease subunit
MTLTIELRPVLLQLPMDIAELLQQFLSAKRIGQFLHTPDVQYMSDPAVTAILDPTKALHIKGTIAWDVQDPAKPTQGFELQDIDVEFVRNQFTLIAGRFGCGKTLMLLTLLGEARVLSGSVTYAVSPLLDPSAIKDGDWSCVAGAVAYVPQVPVILSHKSWLIS